MSTANYVSRKPEHELIWRVKTVDGHSATVRAWKALDAIKASGFEPSRIRKWYPFPIKVVLTDAERAEIKARLETLRNGNPKPKKRKVK